MADAATSFLNLTKPTVGDPAGEDQWGDKLNANFDLLDAAAQAQSDALTAKIGEAPNDGTPYLRQGLGWMPYTAPTVSWADVAGKPDTFTPSAHSHAQADVTNLTADLAARVLKAGDTLTGRLATAVTTAAAAGFNVPPTTVAPTSPVNGDIWTSANYYQVRINGTTQLMAARNLDNAFSAKQTFLPGTTGQASLNIANGAAPTTPVAGDLWAVGDALFYRTSISSSRTLAFTNSSGQSFLNAQTFNTQGTDATRGPIRLTPFTADPTAPADGDIWIRATGLFARVNGVSVQMLTSGANTLTGKLTTLASATGGAGLNLPAGAAPTAPVDGDFWATSTAAYMRFGGVTSQIAFLNGGQNWLTKQTFPQSTTSSASIKITGSTADPATPSNGDIWYNTGVLKFFNGSVNQNFLFDAPSDGNIYARQNGAWVISSGGGGGIADAPNDGTAYVRKSLTWDAATTDDISGLDAALAARLPLAGGTLTGQLNLVGAGSSIAPVKFPIGSAPTGTLTDGMVWFTTNYMTIRVGGSSNSLAFRSADSAFSAKQTFLASVTGQASIRIPPGVSPTSPADGDVWYVTGANPQFRYASTTRALAFQSDTAQPLAFQKTVVATAVASIDFTIPAGASYLRFSGALMPTVNNAIIQAFLQENGVWINAGASYVFGFQISSGPGPTPTASVGIGTSTSYMQLGYSSSIGFPTVIQGVLGCGTANKRPQLFCNFTGYSSASATIAQNFGYFSAVRTASAVSQAFRVVFDTGNIDVGSVLLIEAF